MIGFGQLKNGISFVSDVGGLVKSILGVLEIFLVNSKIDGSLGKGS